MKTLQEIISDVQEKEFSGVYALMDYPHDDFVKAVAKAYASQAIDLAAEVATIKEVPFEHMPLGFSQKVVDKDSILKLKDRLK